MCTYNTHISHTWSRIIWLLLLFFSIYIFAMLILRRINSNFYRNSCVQKLAIALIIHAREVESFGAALSISAWKQPTLTVQIWLVYGRNNKSIGSKNGKKEISLTCARGNRKWPFEIFLAQSKLHPHQSLRCSECTSLIICCLFINYEFRPFNCGVVFVT